MGDQEFSRLDNEGSVDLRFVKVMKRRSHASLIGMHRAEESTIDIAVRELEILFW